MFRFFFFLSFFFCKRGIYNTISATQHSSRLATDDDRQYLFILCSLLLFFFCFILGYSFYTVRASFGESETAD